MAKTKIDKTSNQTLQEIKKRSALILPNRPSEHGMKPDEIKKALTMPIFGEKNSVLSELTRVVNEINVLLSGSTNIGKDFQTESKDLIGAINELNSKKLDKTTESGVYATDASGVDKKMPYSSEDDGNTIALRTAGGRLRVSTPSDKKDAANKRYVDENLNALSETVEGVEDRVSELEKIAGLEDNDYLKSTDSPGVYATDENGEDLKIPYSSDADQGNTIVYRDAEGRVRTADPQDNNDAVNKQWAEARYVNSEIVSDEYNYIYAAKRGGDVTFQARAAAVPNTIAMRDARGDLQVRNDPPLETSAVNKNYVNSLFDDAKTYADQKVAELIDGSPELLDTLYELSEAIGNDPNFSATVTEKIGSLTKEVDTLKTLPMKKGKANGSVVQTGLTTADDPNYTPPVATGIGAMALGRGCVAHGEFSLAFGKNSGAYGTNAISFGYMNAANGASGFVAGSNNVSKGIASVVFGNTNIMNSACDYSFIAGKNNAIASNLDNVNDIYMLGVSNKLSASGNKDVTFVGNGNKITENATAQYGYLLGRDNSITHGVDRNVVLFGYANGCNAKSVDTYIFGKNNNINGDTSSSVCMGVNNEVVNTEGGASNSYCLGSNNKFSNDGSRKNANGSIRNLYMGAIGGYNTVGAQSGLAIGNDNVVNHERTQAIGHHLQSYKDDTVVAGKYNAPSDAAFTVGCGTSDNARKNCFSVGIASGKSYIKIGNKTLTENDCATKDDINLAVYGYSGNDLLIIPDSTDTIEQEYRYSNYKCIIISDNVTNVMSNAFSNCHNLEKVSIGKGLYSIEDSMFYDCTNLKNITIPDTIGHISYFAFGGCTNLASIAIPKHVSNLYYGAFTGCNNLKVIDLTAFESGIDFPINYDIFDSDPPDDFQITVPLGRKEELSSMTNWSEYADNIVEVPTTTSILPASKNYTNLTHYGYTGDDLLVIPQGTKSIANNQYTSSTYKCIVMPDSVTSIGNYAFQGCTYLKSLTISDSITSIGSYAFTYCTDLKTIAVPNTVVSIGDSAFNYCSSLKSFTMPDAVTTVGERLFFHCTNLTDITLSKNTTSIGVNAFNTCSSLKSIVIPATVTSIGSYAFSNCGSLKTVDLTAFEAGIDFPILYAYNFTVRPAGFQIKVPLGRKTELAAMTNWSALANYIVEVPTLASLQAEINALKAQV